MEGQTGKQRGILFESATHSMKSQEDQDEIPIQKNPR